MKSSLSREERLHGVDIPIAGLTGGIATGKSTVASLLEKEGIPVISADKLVKALYHREETKNFLQELAPQCLDGNTIDFPRLRQKAFQDENIRIDLENFLHPKLPELFRHALARFSSPELVVYDIPLLFEKSLQQRFDLVACVYSPKETQYKRLISRDGIDEALAEAMIQGQMDIEMKKKRADVVIDNSGTLEALIANVKDFVRQYL